MSSNNVIQLDGTLSDIQSDSVQTYSSNTIIQLSDQFDDAIDSTASVGEPKLNYIIYANSVEPTTIFGFDAPLLNMQIAALQSIESTVAFGLPAFTITLFADSIESTATFGVAKLNQKLFADSIDNENAFGDSKISSTIFAEPIASTVSFGFDEPLLNMQIATVEGIQSEAVVAVPNVKKVIGPLSINTTANFGIPTFTDNIHRLLIFKEDNLTKVGDSDAVVVAGGIRINPSITKSVEAFAGNATLPSNPVGFISVNIDGNDYRIPYYN
jgi:hypothetical protein